MVVTRRAPTAPASRSNSSQGVPRASPTKGRVSNLSHAPEQSSPLANGKSKEDAQGDADDLSSKKYRREKPKPKKGGKKRKGRKSSLADVLLRYLLLFFTIYSLTVCPSDVELKSPVCRGLSEYRRLVLEPYILPAFHTVISHPSIAPHVERVKPYADRAIQVATPVVQRTQAEFSTRIVPQWNKFVVPQYHRYVVPQYHKYVAPQLVRAQAFVKPYGVAAREKYEQFLGPHLHLAGRTLVRYEQAAQPYVLLAVDKSYTGYQQAKPYLGPMWRRVKLAVAHLVQILRAQRRKFVDPQVAKIWESVKELSRRERTHTSVPAASPVVTATPEPEEVPAPEVETQVVIKVAETPVAAPEPVAEPGPVAEPESEPATLSSTIPSVSDATPSATEALVPEESVQVPIETAFSQVEHQLAPEKIPEPPSEHVHVPETVSEPEEAVESVQASDALTNLGHVAGTTEVPSASSKPTEGLDLDAFYAELGLEEEYMPSTATQNPVAKETPSLTPEEEAELKRKREAAVAQKRADLLARHVKWENEVEALIKEQKKTLRKTIVSLRKVATQELKANEEIKANIDNLVEEAERYLKGAEAYLNNLKKESRKDDEKSGLWERVLEKVQTKFSDRLAETEELVNGWYQARLALEVQEVAQAAAAVRDLAENAQADIGLDYVWLEDVAYKDWQRYHDLVRRADNFTEDATAMQNGTHSSAPINPVLSALGELESEVEDVVMGFETRLRRIKRSGERIFGVLPPETEDDEEIEAGDPESEPEPEVSILPIPDDEAHPAAPEAVSPAPVVGRSKEEVEQAFARADAVEMANSIADEVAAEAITPDVSTSTAAAPAAASVSHVEL